MSNVWFTADRHFDHKNIIRFCGRPFINKEFYNPALNWEKQDKKFWDHELMNDFLIEEHNKLVKKDDDVFDLGDFSFGRDATFTRAASYLRRLHGNLHYLWGNHDDLIKQVAMAHPNLFAWYSKDFLPDANGAYSDGDGSPVYEFKHKGVKLVLGHYAMEVWHGSHKGVGHLYGHSHGTHNEGKSLRFDVGVDCWDYKPVHLDEVLVKLKAKLDGADPRTLAGQFNPPHNFDDK